MENYFRKCRLLPAMTLLGGLALASCVNSDYDFNEVDATMGFGGEGLELPGSSTDTIKLADVLDLGDDDCVKVRPNGDYVFEQVGDNVEPAQPEIAPISVTQRQSVSYDIDINVEPATRSAGDARAVTVVLSADGDMQSFEYDGDKPAEVVDLAYAETDANLSFSLHFPAGLSSVVASLDEISIQMPSFMELSDVSANIGADGSWSIDGSRIVFSNITTSRDLTVSARVSRLRFGVSDELGSLGIDGDKIVLDGRVHVSMNSVATVSGGSIEGLTASSDFAIDDMQITSVTGRFDPEIDLDNLGDVEITGVPDFLTDGNVRVDLYNPQILLTLNSDLNMGGFVGGTLTSWKDGQPIASVTVPEMAVRAGGMTEMCICRNGEGIEGYDVVQVVPELSTLIDTIPDRITFEGTARADRNQTCEFELGHRYTVQPAYRVEAPIAFAENAQIVYKDTIDEWHEDIEDFELSDNSYITFTANIENRVPAYLTLSAYAIDVDGQRMGDDEIKVEVSNTVIASADGETSSETPLTIRVSQNDGRALSRLDGLVFDVTASASDGGANPVEGMTLNSEKHFLIARDIKIKLVGTLIGDFN
ncbi:hypothetical protein [Marseilla massiliensis]|uniref:hypothetical protein n=1 Tax=Marseilla massiliensis TaxID=1841864 RepID=UPI002010CC7A|nr:hypothetical protein [Marseilla massiliensis]MCL1611679.1 hypothetical protein [Marseilla massiliensis]